MSKQSETIRQLKKASFNPNWELSIQQELATVMETLTDECLAEIEKQAEEEERQEAELLDYELRKALANSPEARADYLRRQRRLERMLRK